MSELRYKTRWWCAGLAWLGLVVYLSVADWSMPQAEIQFSDKLNHLLAYGFLMGWFGQLIRRWPQRLLVMGGLIAVGIALEFVQGTLPHRWFDWFDAFANAMGVCIAAVALYFGADNFFDWLERKCRVPNT